MVLWMRKLRLSSQSSVSCPEFNKKIFSQQDGIGEEVLKMSTEEIVQRTRLLDSEIKVGAQPLIPAATLTSFSTSLGAVWGPPSDQEKREEN